MNLVLSIGLLILLITANSAFCIASAGNVAHSRDGVSSHVQQSMSAKEEHHSAPHLHKMLRSKKILLSAGKSQDETDLIAFGNSLNVTHQESDNKRKHEHGKFSPGDIMGGARLASWRKAGKGNLAPETRAAVFVNDKAFDKNDADNSPAGNGFLKGFSTPLPLHAKHESGNTLGAPKTTDSTKLDEAGHGRNSSPVDSAISILSLPFSWFGHHSDPAASELSSGIITGNGAAQLGSDGSGDPNGANGPSGGPGNPSNRHRFRYPREPINSIPAGESSDPNTPGTPDNPAVPDGNPKLAITGGGNTKQPNIVVPVTMSPSFIDLHKQQTQIFANRMAQFEKQLQVQPGTVPQSARTHKDWGQIGGMTQGGLSMTEPPSPNNVKIPTPGQFDKPVQLAQIGTAHGTATGYVFVPGESPPSPPYWFTQPAAAGKLNDVGHWYPGQINSPGVPYTAGIQAVATTVGAQISSEINNTPNFQTTQAKTQAETQNIANATNAASDSNLQHSMRSAVQGLVNIANENSSGPYGKAVKMIQTMWKSTFLPIAILLVLPGTLLTQVKGLVKVGVVDDANDEDGVSPFVGLLRGLIAVFLIPATQLIVSYTIDIGNSMTEVVAQQVQLQDVSTWASKQTSKPKAANPADQAKVDQNESGKSAFKRATFGFIDSLFTNALVILLAYQTVMVCYLFLLGPIAAALYAWPSTTNALFKNVFSSWINGLVSLTLWRFWWSLIILCMCIRIQWLKELGEYNPNSPWEGVAYTAFVVMLTYIPFIPFEFKPGSLVTSLLDKAGQGGASGGGSGAGSSTSSSAPTAPTSPAVA